MWILLAAAIAQTAYWLAVWVQLVRTVRFVPTARSILRQTSRAASPGQVGVNDTVSQALGVHATSPVSVCVIIPAHNEESCIAAAERSVLNQQWGDGESAGQGVADRRGLKASACPAPRVTLVLALDRCTDQTRAEAERAVPEADRERVEIIEITQCPDDWAGKSHALWRAVHDACLAKSADVLVFVDADTQLDARCLEASLQLLNERRLVMLSLLSTLTSDQLFERVAQPAAAFELVRQFPILRANSWKGQPARRPFANGQFIMIRREAYLQIGGHEARRGEVLEDVELAREVARHNLPAGVFIADRMLACRMYASGAEFRHGWTRIFRESCNNRAGRMRAFAWRLRLTGVFLPLTALLAVAFGAANLTELLAHAPPELRTLAIACITLGGVGLVTWWALLAIAYHMSRVGWFWSMSYPIGAWQVSNILLHAAREQARGEPITWGGRSYHRPARR